jgi:hypothetical protein
MVIRLPTAQEKKAKKEKSNGAGKKTPKTKKKLLVGDGARGPGGPECVPAARMRELANFGEGSCVLFP